MGSTFLWFFIARLCTGFESSFLGEEGFRRHRQSRYRLLARCNIVILWQEVPLQLPVGIDQQVEEVRARV